MSFCLIFISLSINGSSFLTNLNKIDVTLVIKFLVPKSLWSYFLYRWCYEKYWSSFYKPRWTVTLFFVSIVFLPFTAIYPYLNSISLLSRVYIQSCPSSIKSTLVKTPKLHYPYGSSFLDIISPSDVDMS